MWFWRKATAAHSYAFDSKLVARLAEHGLRPEDVDVVRLPSSVWVTLRSRRPINGPQVPPELSHAVVEPRRGWLVVWSPAVEYAHLPPLPSPVHHPRVLAVLHRLHLTTDEVMLVPIPGGGSGLCRKVQASGGFVPGECLATFGDLELIRRD